VTCRPWPSPVSAGSGGRRWRSCSMATASTSSQSNDIADAGHPGLPSQSTKPPVRQTLGPADCLRSRTASPSPARRSAARSGCAPAGACRPGCRPAAESSVDRSRSIAPNRVARARCGFHPHPTLVALTASGKPSERIDCAQRWSMHRRAPHPDRRRARQGLGARVLAQRGFAPLQREHGRGSEPIPRHTARRRETPVPRRRSPAPH
jgi:hypothetical protein